MGFFQKVQPRQPRIKGPRHVTLAQELLEAGGLTRWEVNFLTDIQRRKRLTMRQRDKLLEIDERSNKQTDGRRKVRMA